jgi:tripartite-type tricarboxylate transporter receptor subunit TctC
MITGVPDSITHIKSGRLRPLAIASQTRHPLIAEVPTTAEAGLPAQTITSWTALLVPAATPKPVVNRINNTVVTAMRQPEMTQRLRDQGFEVIADAPDAAQAFIATEAARWGKLVREANLKPD